MKALLLHAATVCFYICTQAQFVAPPGDDTFKTVTGPLRTQARYKEVSTGPGSICEQNASVISYSGFLDVSEHEHVFFWFFGARDIRPEDASLTAWISGGPGSSSMSELFTEHGPCSIDQDFHVSSNPYAWNAVSNVVYIDQPITVGFSYSDPIPSYIQQTTCDIIELPNQSCPDFVAIANDNCDNYGPGGPCGTFPKPDPRYTSSSTEGAAETFYLALQAFFAAFPQYTKHGFTLGSESYGGHYAPVFSRFIAQQNRNASTGAIQIPQTSVIVNNGWFDPAVAYSASYAFLVDPGNTYDVKIDGDAAQRMRTVLSGPGNCLDQLAVCNSDQGTDVICQLADDFCSDDLQSVYGRQLGRDEYDVRELDPSPFPPSYYVEYLNSLAVLQELAVFTNYTDQSQVVTNTFEATGDDARELGITQALIDLLDSGMGVTLLHGDADYNSNWYGGEVMVSRIANGSTIPGLKDAYASAGFQNLTTTDQVVHGQVKQAGLLSFVRVYEAGHQVGFFQPLAEQAIFERTLTGRDIATGQINASAPLNGTRYRSTGPARSTYREGNSTVQFLKVPSNATYNHTTNEPNQSR